jgi:predicted TIM-barrel fold metal-dependent hydrolase
MPTHEGSTGRPTVSRSSMKVTGISGSLEERGPVTRLPDPVPGELWCPIISGDDHVLEPPNMFEGRVPRRFAGSVPNLVQDEDGIPFWAVGDGHIPFMIGNGSVGRPPSEWNNVPQKLEDFRPGVTDPAARLADMDLNGVWASMCFPSLVWGFAGRVFAAFKDVELGQACVRAYNDWMIEEWCSTAPDRYIPCQMPWLADPKIAAEGVYANAERGFRAVTFPESPDRLGFPSVHSGQWDPFFRACEETQTVINLHVGSSGWVQRPSVESPVEVAVALFPLSGMAAMVDWMYARVPLAFPGIRVALSEAGVSWVPMMMERLQRAYRHVSTEGAWTAADPHPHEVLSRNFWFTSIEDPSAFRSLDLIGEDRVLLESDYPHQDSTWPATQSLLHSELGHLDHGTVRKLAYKNGAQLYRWEPPPDDWLERSVIGAG